MSFDINALPSQAGRIAIVTCANIGLGYETTKALAEKGATVIMACRNEAKASAAKEILLAENSQFDLHILPLDLCNLASVRKFATDFLAKFDQLDLLINNAGLLEDEQESIRDINFEKWAKAHAVNTLAPIHMAQSLLPSLSLAKTQNGEAKIVTISSIMGALSRVRSDSYAYRSTKAAVNKAMQILAEELKPEGFIVCPVHPGWVKTDMGGDEAEIEIMESARGLFNLIRKLTPEQSGRFWQYDGTELDW